jgi:hypothetical protein
MRTTHTGATAGLGAVVLGCFGALVHCGGGGSSASPPGDVPQMTTKSDDDGGTTDASAHSTNPPCDAKNACTGASTVQCCDGFCVDTAKDPNNCGKCGAVCTENQFCTGTSCNSAVIANVCDNARATVALDPYSEDNEAGAAMGTALMSDCVPATQVLQTAQSTSGVLDPDSGRPITGAGDTFVTGGGGYGQQGVAYMESSITPLHLWGDGTTGEIRTQSDAALVSTPVTNLTAHHDYFYVQVSVEPQSSTLCFSSVGMLGPGTLAAGYYTSTELVPNRSKYTASWYVYEWTDTNSDSVPNAGDTVRQGMAGP